MYLERIAGPADVKSLLPSELPALCEEIRRAIVQSSAAVGGHVGSNLAVVELTVALHRVFDSPTDKIVFDVSHQCYAHKMLTGRAHGFTDPDRYEDVSGFTNPAESPHDHFAVGHTSTAASLACGMAKARDLLGQDHNVVAVIGDGSLSGGLAFEGLDSAAELGSGVIFIVNDNEWSIAPDAGGIYRGLAELRRTRGSSSNNLFRALGLEYRYLEDGNDVEKLVDALTELRGCTKPTVLHIHTRKGLGYAPAEADPEAWHHVGPFDAATGASTRPAKPASRDYAQITGDHLLARMKKDRRIVAVSAATPYIMGFGPERRAAAGDQFVDVGIAEEHAVTFAAALAQSGARPVFGVYGTFLQRGFDELMHDVALNGAPVTILVFGCSARGTTDATHLGIFDIPMLGCVPGLTYLAPTCAEEYLDMLDWSLDRSKGPVAIRVPAAGYASRPGFSATENYALPAMELVRPDVHPDDDGLTAPADVALLALGDAFPLGEKAAHALAEDGIRAVLANPRQATFVDYDGVSRLADSGCRLFVTLEDGVLEGGFGEKVARALAPRGDVRVRCLGLPRAFPDRYDPDELLGACGLTESAVVRLVRSELSQ